MSRLGPAFERLRSHGRLGLMVYVTCGFPRLDGTLELVVAAVRGGADMVELGIPFSDPLADGPTIQAASQQALAAGMTVGKALQAARQCRERVSIPLLFMTYLNPVLRFGVDRFCRQAAAAGVDGLIIPDLPPAEVGLLGDHAGANGLDLGFFVSPTSSPERITAACRAATGFIYCIAVTGITGARDRLDPALLPMLESVRARTSLPVVVGFGLSRADHLRALVGRADAAIVASALLDAIAQNPAEAAGVVERFVAGLRLA